MTEKDAYIEKLERDLKLAREVSLARGLHIDRLYVNRMWWRVFGLVGWLTVAGLVYGRM